MAQVSACVECSKDWMIEGGRSISRGISATGGHLKCPWRKVHNVEQRLFLHMKKMPYHTWLLHIPNCLFFFPMDLVYYVSLCWGKNICLDVFFADMNSKYCSYKMEMCRETLGEGRQKAYLIFASSCGSVQLILLKASLWSLHTHASWLHTIHPLEQLGNLIHYKSFRSLLLEDTLFIQDK